MKHIVANTFITHLEYNFFRFLKKSTKKVIIESSNTIISTPSNQFHNSKFKSYQ